MLVSKILEFIEKYLKKISYILVLIFIISFSCYLIFNDKYGQEEKTILEANLAIDSIMSSENLDDIKNIERLSERNDLPYFYDSYFSEILLCCKSDKYKEFYNRYSSKYELNNLKILGKVSLLTYYKKYDEAITMLKNLEKNSDDKILAIIYLKQMNLYRLKMDNNLEREYIELFKKLIDFKLDKDGHIEYDNSFKDLIEGYSRDEFSLFDYLTLRSGNA